MVSMNIVCYLFLAGMGSSAFLIGFTTDLLIRIRSSRYLRRMSLVTDAGLFAGPVVVAASSAFLVVDLGVPERFLLVFFSPSSILTWGAWGLLIFVLASVLALALSPFATTLLGRFAESTCQLLSSVSALFVLLYSAVFLSSYPSVPFLNSAAVPVLFVVSSLSAGLALVLLIAFVRGRVMGVLGEIRPLIHFEVVVIVFEIIVLAVFMGSSAALDNCQTYDAVAGILFGPQSALFWIGVVLSGMFVPLILDILNSRKVNMWLAYLSSIYVLAGAFCLRYVLLASAVRYGLPLMLPVQFWL